MDAVFVHRNEYSVYVEYTIAGSDFVIENLKIACIINNEREISQYKIISPRLDHPIQSDQGLGGLVSNDDNPKCIIMQSNVAAVCMACLQESMEARTLFRFHVLNPRGGDAILLVLFGSTLKEVPKKYCIKLCPLIEEMQISTLRICMEVARHLPFRKDDTSLSLSNWERTSAIEVFAVGESSQADLHPSEHDQRIMYPPLQGLKLSKSLLGHKFIHCRLCLVIEFRHALLPSDGRENCIYLMNPVSKQQIEMMPCFVACGEVEVMDRDAPECQLKVDDHRLPFSADEEFLAQVPSRPRNDKFAATHKLSMSSGCIWVQSEDKNIKDNDKCVKCIRGIRSVDVMKLSDATALASIRPLQTRHDRRKMQLALCVSVSKCLQLLFFPNAMCFYQMNIQRFKDAADHLPTDYHLATSAGHIQLMKDYRNDQASTSSVTRTSVTDTWDHPTSSAHQNHSQYIDDLRHHLTSRHSFGEQPADVEGLGETWQTLDLFPLDPGFIHTEKLHQTSTEAKLKKPRFQEDLTVSRDSGTFKEADGSHITNVRIVVCAKYSVGCLKCLALHGEMLLFSSVYFYAWLISGTGEKDHKLFVGCGVVRAGSPMNLDIYPRRPISFASIASILSTT
ncbi:unnamed protein product [Albugo candida]|uniref:Uncharacterized protein n=1 Tax=Albugo candida TaxID=65357 RepID=A0A024FVD4_9STRA|nr:unnamed protein product [Albugo candida]|eukprot:CCI11080.1 unnamed protein product [Albugo candida]